MNPGQAVIPGKGEDKLMRLVLTTPPFDLFKDGYGSKRSITKGHIQPLGVGYIAAAVLKSGKEAFIVDPPAEGLGFEDTVARIRSLDPDVVGISALTSNQSQALKLAAMLKETLGVPVIIGGAHATCYPEEILKGSDSIDFLVNGEGEKVIAPLLDCIARGEKPSLLKGVAFKDDGKIIENGKCVIETDLDNLEPPAYHLYNHRLYSPLPYAYKRLPSCSMMTSRGCPYSRCAFCFSAGKMKQMYRRHSPSRVVRDISGLVNDFGIREIIFGDDNFLFNERWISEFCDRLRSRHIDITWSCCARADTVTAGMLRKIKEAGCWTVFYGFESGVQRLLDTIKKGTTIDMIRQAVEWTHSAGLETRGSFMLALPGETPEDARQTIEFAIALDLDYAQFHATFPDPGTELYEIARTKGRVGPYRGTNKATFIPEAYRDGNQVEEMVRLAYRRFYIRPEYIWKRIKSIKNISDLTRYIEGFLFVRGLQ